MAPKRQKRHRLGHSDTPADRRCAEHPNHVWAPGYQFDVTAAGRTIKILHAAGELTRESPAGLVEYSIDADGTAACLDKITGARGRRPELIRSENGPELTANALRVWCRLGGTQTIRIEAGSPWENPWVESCNSRTRDELLAIEHLDALIEAQIPVAGWRIE